MFSNSSQLPSRMRAQTPTRSSRLTASSPISSRGTSKTVRAPTIRPLTSMSSRTPVRAGLSANPPPRFNSFTTPSRPASSMGNVRPTTPSFNRPLEQQTYCGTVKVSVRPRPLPNNAQSYGWDLDTLQNTITSTELGEYQYDHVYDPLSSNFDVYCHTVKPVVDKCMEGCNGTIFAYGMTGSGKTHSMQGSDYEAGIIQLAVNEMYERMEFEQDKKNFTVTLSYLEIYNEKLYDLLNPDTSNLIKSSSSFSSSSSSSLLKDELKIRDDPVFGVNIVGLHQQSVQSPDELLTYIAKGDSIRRTGGTDFNARSSRSHAIVMIRLNSLDVTTGTETFSTLSLCDLAGSEKATTQQERRKEGSYINKSLLALSTVISKLSAQSLNNGTSASYANRTHIPYRDSKLTRLLQNSLSGNSLISILCTIHLSPITAPETINTLRFAARAKNIQVAVKRNESLLTTNSGVEKDKIILRLKSELDKYKADAKSANLKLQQSTLLSPVSSNSTSRQTSLDSSSSMSNSVFSSLDQQQYTKLEEEVNQLLAENRILMEQVEHYKRLNDYSRLNSTMVKNEYVQSLSSLEINKNYEDIHEIVVGLEDFYKKQMIEIEELSSYKIHLENMLKRAELSHGDKNSESSIVKDQEEEIMDLKEQLSSKNAIIQLLKNSNKVRDSFTMGGNSKRSRIPSLSHKRSDESMRSSNNDMNLSVEMNSSVVLLSDNEFANTMLNSSPPHRQIEIEDSW